MAADMSVGDMAKVRDMSMPDLEPPPGSGFILSADVVGTAFTSGADAGTEVAAPLTHMVQAAVNLPTVAAPATASNFSFDIGTLTISGCIANRYDFVTKFPNPDTNAGVVAVSGYATKLMTPVPKTVNSTGLLGPIPDVIGCVNPITPLPNYLCFYNPGGSGTLDGASTNAMVFPLIPDTGNMGAGGTHPLYLGLCGLTGANCTAADCTPHNFGGGPPPAEFCEQKVFRSGQTINVNVGGGGGYGASSTNFRVDADDGGVRVPTAITITDIKVGSNSLGVTDISAITGFDPAQNLTISFSCDGTGTAGSGCSGSGPFDLAILVGATSDTDRTAFSPGTDFGTLTCIEQVNSKSSFVVPANILQAMLGSQTTGSINLTAMHANAALGTGSQNNLIAVGRGVFGFFNF
jgi:hypothetical protein